MIGNYCKIYELDNDGVIHATFRELRDAFNLGLTVMTFTKSGNTTTKMEVVNYTEEEGSFIIGCFTAGVPNLFRFVADSMDAYPVIST